MLQSRGPLLIAANHPNSFLDAIVLATIFKKPIYSLARGDAFANSFYSKLLTSLKMFPVYRISEGVENLENNYKTFEQCLNIFKQNGIVLIFSEGRCVNEWHLRSLKKGTARLAVSAWQNGIPLQVLPTGINYNSFYSFGKNIQLNFGEIITEKDILTDSTFGKNIIDFNEKLQAQLKQLVIEIDPKDKARIKEIFFIEQSFFKKMILAIPAAAGWLIHCTLYFAVRYFTRSKARFNDHYDSVMMGLLFLLYPFYMLLTGLIFHSFICGSWWLLTFIVLPFCAWSYVQLKQQIGNH